VSYLRPFIPEANVMGCDIHLILEAEQRPDHWVGVTVFNHISTKCFDLYDMEKPKSHYFFWLVTGRNYELFGKLAGVRSNQGPPPRGLPRNISELARLKINHWGADGHSHSWGLLSEIGGLFLAAYNPRQILEAERHQAVAELFNIDLSNDDELNRYRLVYFFDN
jgi:hypothetical protein